MNWKTAAAVVSVALAAGIAFLPMKRRIPESTNNLSTLTKPGRPVTGLAYDSPMVAAGIRRPPALSAAAATIGDDALVLGVNVHGQARAYPVSALSAMTSHVVNDVVGDIPVSVTYCDQNDCARVFTKPGQDEPIDLWQQGWVNQELSLMLDGVAFGQSSTSAPLDDVAFERTTWGQWKADHPETDIVVLDTIAETNARLSVEDQEQSPAGHEASTGSD